MTEELPRRALLVGAVGAAACVPYQRDDLVQKLDREIIACNQENQRLREQLTTCDSDQPLPAIFTELRQILPNFGVDVVRKGTDSLVVIPEALAFAPRSVRLRSESDAIFDLLSTALNMHVEHDVTVVGHSDDQPPDRKLIKQFPTNWELSSARAAAVVRSLSEEWGISPHRFTVAGRGPWEPIADNATPEGREANRRVEVYIHRGPAPLEETE